MLDINNNRGNSLGERIRRVRQSQGLTQKIFADSLGIAQGYLSSIENGSKTPSDTLLIALKHLYQLDEHWLFAEGNGESSGPEFAREASSGKTPLLARIPQEFPHGLEAADILGHVCLPDSSPDSYAILAYGDFMAPTIHDNDLVVFKPSREARNGDIVLVSSKWGDVILRRYRVNDGEVWFSPDNSMYKPFQPLPDTRIIGTVKDAWRKMKL